MYSAVLKSRTVNAAASAEAFLITPQRVAAIHYTASIRDRLPRPILPNAENGLTGFTQREEDLLPSNVMDRSFRSCVLVTDNELCFSAFIL